MPTYPEDYVWSWSSTESLKPLVVIEYGNKQKFSEENGTIKYIKKEWF